MRSFQRAVEYGCTMVECDVQRTADGVPVLAHDPEVTDRTGRLFIIEKHSSEVLRRLDLGAGEGVPTLRDLAEWARGRCIVMADMKCEGEGIEESVLEALAVLPDSARIVTGAREGSRRHFRALAPTLPLSLTLNVAHGHRADGPDFAEKIAAIDTDAVTWEYPLLNAERVAALHVRGLHVYAWTVDELPTMRRLLDEGVDGLISNRPDLLTTL
jgi:glycerophosphoryl diester phosphodiesterase